MSDNSTVVIPSLNRLAQVFNVTNEDVTIGNLLITLEQARKIYHKYYPEFTFPLVDEGYIQIEYVEATGVQYIDIDYKPTENTRCVIDFETSKNFSAYTGMFGARNSLNTDAFCIWLAGNTVNPQFGDVSSGQKTLAVTYSNKRLIYDYDQNSFKIDGKELNLGNYSITCNSSLTLFGINSGNSVDSRRVQGKIYSVKIYENGVIQRKLTPAKNIENGEIGLYDNITKNFYINSGAGSLTAGPVVETTNYSYLNKRCLTLNQLKILSDHLGNYKLLDHIVLTGTQFIDTGYKPKNNSRIVCKIYIDENQPQSTAAIFGGRTNSAPQQAAYCLWHISESSFRFDYGSVNTSSGPEPSGMFLIDSNKNVIKLNDKTTTLAAQTFTSANSLRIASTYTNTGSEFNDSGHNDLRRFSGKIYYFKIYNNSTLVRDYVPVKRISDGAIGLYDKVNKLFYGNDGTGSFGAGPEVGYV